MANIKQIVDSAEAQVRKSSCYHWRRDLAEQAVEAGLTSGDTVALGGGLVAKIQGAIVEMVHNGKTTATIQIKDLTGAQLTAILTKKAIAMGSKSVSMGLMSY